MTTLVRWTPFVQFSGLHRAMDVLEDFAQVRSWANPEAAELTFPVDLSETEDKVMVKAVLPGMKAEDVDITVSDDVLTIKGEKKHEETTENFYRKEIRYGAFARSIPLPGNVKYEDAEADFGDGILTVTLPKAEEALPKSITIRPSQKELSGTASAVN
jgi:HSP20 family protein